MHTRLLSEADYQATLASPMRDIRNSDGPFVDIAPYLKAIAPQELNGHVMLSEIPERVYLTPDRRYEHYLLPTKAPNVYLVIIADNMWRGFHGHRLLDLNDLYGLEEKQK